MSTIEEMIVNAWKILLAKTSQQQRLPLEVFNSFIDFLPRVRATQAHFFHGNKSIAKLSVFSLVYCPKATPSQLFKQTVTLLEQTIECKKSSGSATLWFRGRILCKGNIGL